jgi:hypothetical protein
LPRAQSRRRARASTRARKRVRLSRVIDSPMAGS